MSGARDMNDKAPEEQLAGFIAKYTPEIGALAQEAHAKMRARLPGAIGLVYDNYNALAIGFSQTERTSDVIFSISSPFRRSSVRTAPHNTIYSNNSGPN